jgi:hypothetical protein
MASPPSGFSVQAEAAPSGTMEVVGLKFVNGERIVRVYGTNLGMQGVFAPEGPHNPMGSTFTRRQVDGVPTAFFSQTEDAAPTAGVFVTWVAGGWGYTAAGWMFESNADFLDVLSSLQLTDAATFAAVTPVAEAIDPQEAVNF